MSINRKAEARLLDRTELDLVAPTHYPDLCHLDLDDLRSRRRLLREYRDKARDRARQQRREMRGKGEPRAAAEARDNTGTARKGEVLSAALKRVNRQILRLEKEARAETQGEIASRAIALKRAGAPRHHPAAGRHAAGGMRAHRYDPPPRADPREAGRVSQATRVAQARRDARG
jgi:hypothetical protein